MQKIMEVSELGMLGLSRALLESRPMLRACGMQVHVNVMLIAAAMHVMSSKGMCEILY